MSNRKISFLAGLLSVILLWPLLFTSAIAMSEDAGGFQRFASSSAIKQSIVTNNQLPIADAGYDWYAGTYIQVTLDGTASSDPDGNYPLSYLWTQTSGPLISLDDPTSATPKLVTPLVPCVLVYSLVVTDSIGGISIPDEVVVTVFNTPPVANAGQDQLVATNSSARLDASGSYDPNGDIPLSYSWVQTTGPVVTLSNPNAIRPSFTTPQYSTAISFDLIVTDSHGQVSLPDSVEVTVYYFLFLPGIFR